MPSIKHTSACVGIGIAAAVGLVLLSGALGVSKAQTGPGNRPQSALAQRVLAPPVANTPSEGPPTTVTGNPAPFLQAILGQLVVMNNELHRATAAAHGHDRTCSYGDRAYTEGSLLKVEGVKLLCVEALTGTEQWGVGEAAVVNGETRFVWEPLSSPRLERFREIAWRSPLAK